MNILGNPLASQNDVYGVLSHWAAAAGMHHFFTWLNFYVCLLYFEAIVNWNDIILHNSLQDRNTCWQDSWLGQQSPQPVVPAYSAMQSSTSFRCVLRIQTMLIGLFSSNCFLIKSIMWLPCNVITKQYSHTHSAWVNLSGDIMTHQFHCLFPRSVSSWRMLQLASFLEPKPPAWHMTSRALQGRIRQKICLDRETWGSIRLYNLFNILTTRTHHQRISAASFFTACWACVAPLLNLHLMLKEKCL